MFFTWLILIVSFSAYGQYYKTDYGKMIDLRYDVNNNFRHELKSNPSLKSLSIEPNLAWVNIYFRYSKNPRWQEANEPSVKQTVVYEYIQRCEIDQNLSNELIIPFKIIDKLAKPVVRIYNINKGRLSHKKVKKSNFKIEILKLTSTVKIDKAILSQGSWLELYYKSETEVFDSIGPIYLERLLKDEDSQIYVSMSYPDFYTYQINEGVKLFPLESNNREQLKLWSFKTEPYKGFSRPTRFYVVLCKSAKWEVINESNSNLVLFTLEEMNLFEDIGLKTRFPH